MNEYDEMDKNALSERIRTIVKKAGSIEKLAKAANISKGVIQQYLSGASDPGRKKMIALANVGGVTIEWLATGKGIRERLPLNIGVLRNVMEEVERILATHGLDVQPSVKVKLISNLYEDIVKDGKSLDEIRKELVKIADYFKQE